MPQPALLLFEGIPGSGKSTMAERICKHLRYEGIPAVLHPEGCDHPVDLTWHAYYNTSDYRDLLARHPRQAPLVRAHTIPVLDTKLIHYRNMNESFFEGDLLEDLRSREFCYGQKPMVPLDIFTRVFTERWRQFTQQALSRSEVVILESAFIQHPIHDLIRLYDAKPPGIMDHLAQLLNQITCLNPLLFYLAQDSVRETLERTAVLRCKPNLAMETAFQYWEHRKLIELDAIKQLKVNSVIISNPHQDWDAAYQRIIETIKNGTQIFSDQKG